MKKLTIALSLSFVLIAGCMVYLLRAGVSLRAEPLIKPTVIDSEMKSVGHSIVLRLFPEFQTQDVILWGILPLTDESRKALEQTRREYEAIFKQSVTLVEEGVRASADQLKNCTKSCWVLLPRAEAHELQSNSFNDSKLKPLGKSAISISWFDFEWSEPIPEHCLEEQRLNYECIRPLMVHEVQRKVKNREPRYFFMRKYNNRSHFLWVQKPPSLKL